MIKTKKTKVLQDTLSRIDGVMAALDSYPSLEDAVLERAQQISEKIYGKYFPTQLDFSNQVLEHLIGTDKIIEILSKFLIGVLPEVEVSLKLALLANMNNLGTNCTIDPIIWEKNIKEGIMFDLKQIDLIDKLTISPLDKKLGQYYYFGIDDCESAYDVLQSAISPDNNLFNKNRVSRKARKNKDDLNKRADKDLIGMDSTDSTSTEEEATKATAYTPKTSGSYVNNNFTHYGDYKRQRDFDCLLWYMKNKAAYREVWGKKTMMSEDIFYGADDPLEWLKGMGDKGTVYYYVNEDDSIDIYTYDKSTSAWVKDEDNNNARMIAVNKDDTYTYQSGKTQYTYKFKKAATKKLSQKKYYYVTESYDEKTSKMTATMYLYANGWRGVHSSQYTNYKTPEEVPLDDTLKGDLVCIDKSFYKITQDNSLKGKEECIDLTNEIENNLYQYLDGDNEESVITVITDIDGNTITGKQKWSKDKGSNGTVKVNDSYLGCGFYVDNDLDGHYNPDVDKLLITPYILKTNDNGVSTAKKAVSINKKMDKLNRYTKKFGIVTLEFSPSTGNIRQSDGNPMQQQTPYDNVLHVFFGNVKELHTTERDELQEEWQRTSQANWIGAAICNKVEELKETHIKLWNKKKKYWKEKTDSVRGDTIYIWYTENGEERYASYYEDTLYGFAVDWYNAVLNGNSTAQISEVNQRLYSKLIQGESISESLYTNENGALEDVLDDIDEILSGLTTSAYCRNEEGEWDSFDFQNFQDKMNELCGVLNGYSITAYANRMTAIMNANENLLYMKATNLTYPEAKKNYYLRRTLFEFNTDYVNSLQLFDPKVVAAQLITSLLGGASISAMIGATASWKTEYIRDTVTDMVMKVIAAEDVTVSDCFFTFSNDTYSNMLRATELRQAGLYSAHGEENGNSTIDPIELLSSLNELNETADQAGQISVIQGALTTVAGEVSKDEWNENSYLSINTNLGIKISFIQTLIINLCTQMVMAILSPKVYLLILINFEMFGITTNYDYKTFLQNFVTLINTIVKSIVKQVMQFILNEILSILDDLVQKLINKISFEQAEMYSRLLKQILLHLRMLFGRSGGADSIGWTQDTVYNADITSSEETEEPVDEC